jgi:hypothetical protein
MQTSTVITGLSRTVRVELRGRVTRDAGRDYTVARFSTGVSLPSFHCHRERDGAQFNECEPMRPIYSASVA